MHASLPLASGPPPTSSKVLVVDDDQDFVELLRRLMADIPGVQAETAGSLQAALAAVTTGRFDCVLLDLSLPDAEGEGEVTTRKLVDAAGATPVVVMSGEHDAATPARVRRAGALECLPKAELSRGRLAELLAHAVDPVPPAQPTTAARVQQSFTPAVVVGSALCSIGIAAVVLVGWIVRDEALTGAVDGLPSMRANTAVGVVLCALSLLAQRRPTGMRSSASRLACATVAVYGALSLLEEAIGSPLGVGELVSGDFSSAAGRPAPHTALALLLFAAAQLTLDSRRQRAHLLFGAGYAFVTFLAAIGYLYGSNLYTGGSGPGGMALPTAVALLLLLIGGAAQRPDRRWLRRLLADTAGGTLLRRLGAAVLLLTPVLGFLRLIGQDAGWYDHRFGTALYAVVMVVIFLLLLVRTAQQVDRDERERALAAAAVDRSERRYRTLNTVAPVGIIETRPDGSCLHVNPAWCDLSGLTPREAWGWGWRDVLHPDDRPAVTRAWQRAAEGTGFTLELRLRRPEGEPTWVSLRGSAVRDEHGGVVGVLATAGDVTALKAAEAGARAERLRMQALLDHAPMSVTLRDLDGRYLIINRFAAGMMGTTVEELQSRPVEDLFDPRSAKPIDDQEREVRETLRAVEAEVVTKLSDGTDHWVSITKYPVVDDAGRLMGVGGISTDITERKRAEARISEAEERFRLAFDNAPIGMTILDADGRCERVNEALCAITGYSAEQLRSMPVRTLSHRADLPKDDPAMAKLASGELPNSVVEKRYRHVLGEPVWVSVHMSVLERDETGRPLRFLKQVQDITERRRLEDNLRHLADHDPLTGLLNRRGFGRELDQHLARNKRYGARGVLLVIDLDHFKYVNDTLGHTAGDELIVTVARLLRDRLRETDFVARLGGDEFAVLLPEATIELGAEVAASIVERIRAGAQVTVADKLYRVTASVGVTALDESVEGPDEVLVNADLAMYDAKEAGRDRHSLCSTDGYASRA